jgi:hypothetical protein
MFNALSQNRCSIALSVLSLTRSLYSSIHLLLRADGFLLWFNNKHPTGWMFFPINLEDPIYGATKKSEFLPWKKQK